MSVIERPLLPHLDIQTPDYARMGFVLGLSRLGDKLGQDWPAYTPWVEQRRNLWRDTQVMSDTLSTPQGVTRAAGEDEGAVVTTTAANGRIWTTAAQRPAVAPGSIVQVAARRRTFSSLGTGATSGVLRIVGYDAAGSHRSNGFVTTVGRDPAPNSDDALAVTLTIPSWVVSLELGLYGGAAVGDKVAWSRVYVGLPGSYFDGSTNPVGELERTRYLGAASASASVLETRTLEPRPDAWNTWIRNATDITIKRGFVRRGVGLRTDVGIMTFTLSNDQDPLRGGVFQPGQIVRAVQHTPDGPQPLFTGTITDIGAAYPFDKSTGTLSSRTTVTVSDAVLAHTQTMRYGVRILSGFETFEERIRRLEASSRVPVAVPPLGDPKEVYAF